MATTEAIVPPPATNSWPVELIADVHAAYRRHGHVQRRYAVPVSVVEPLPSGAAGGADEGAR